MAFLHLYRGMYTQYILPNHYVHHQVGDCERPSAVVVYQHLAVFFQFHIHIQIPSKLQVIEHVAPYPLYISELYLLLGRFYVNVLLLC
ncbi:unnamed protein product [Schistosoma mattheei]|uniref:Uncharacterized protein n=1 Tax=Schistosoma mattheei TaxID=31246 RepID=A0A3P8K344_9TREM|nr:unnamed protein product [Schistosoma mattheei]